MRKSFKLQNLECANCAGKMESGIQKLNGVQQVSVQFISQKLVIEAEEEQFDEILAAAQKIIRKIEPDCILVRG